MAHVRIFEPITINVDKSLKILRNVLVVFQIPTLDCQPCRHSALTVDLRLCRQVAELQKELKSSTERMLSNNRPKPAQDAGEHL